MTWRSRFACLRASKSGRSRASALVDCRNATATVRDAISDGYCVCACSRTGSGRRASGKAPDDRDGAPTVRRSYRVRVRTPSTSDRICRRQFSGFYFFFFVVVYRLDEPRVQQRRHVRALRETRSRTMDNRTGDFFPGPYLYARRDCRRSGSFRTIMKVLYRERARATDRRRR